MRRYLPILLFIGLTFAQDKYVAVFNLENNGLKDNQVRSVRNRLESELKKTGLKVVEREQINDLFKEQKLQFSGVVEDSLVRKIGSMLGASKLIIQSILFLYLHPSNIKSQQGLIRETPVCLRKMSV